MYKMCIIQMFAMLSSLYSKVKVLLFSGGVQDTKEDSSR